jgi:Zn-dependent membrane protease YugP
MIRNPRAKRILSISLLILGGMLMFFAPENIWIGAILFTLGVGFEIVGLVLRRRK